MLKTEDKMIRNDEEKAVELKIKVTKRNLNVEVSLKLRLTTKDRSNPRY